MKAQKRKLRDFRRTMYWNSRGFGLPLAKRQRDLLSLEKKIDVYFNKVERLNLVLSHEYTKDIVQHNGGCTNLKTLQYNAEFFGDKLPRGKAFKRILKLEESWTKQI